MVTRRRWSHSWMLAMVFLVQGTTTIRITGVRVPERVEAGGEGQLECSWQEELDHMYSIKWYQGAHEFYRYTPTAHDPVQIFDPPTLDVDKEKSWGGIVRVANVSLAAEGPFHCEVSADGPTFHTASDSSIMTVVDIPEGAPVISGVRSQYLVDDLVDLTCTSRRSRPPPDLSFTINTQQVLAEWVEPQTDVVDEEGLTTSSLRMQFSLMPGLLRHGEVRVRCVSEIPGIYRQESYDVLTTRQPYHASVLGGGATPGIRPSLVSVSQVIVLALLLSLPHL
ncbi:uncharacterized protein LOC121873666 [Homarus americanus]|uniref:uncharacterized protein LOC121873666 n=1 Tax=Homarus americanus TaxID=6706 RepID=UPI001C436E87|nr:uncharacterized protein LOC121873666 [Homarus americanus]